MRRFTPLLIVFLSHIYASPQYERVHMKDVTSLVLDSSQYTTGRRSAPVKQLACIGGPCHLAPSRAICFQKGWDGRDAVWECKADMVGAKFGRLEVLCEGFSSPDDPYILHGSCGLQYTLESTSPEKLEADTSVQFPATTDRVLLKDITTLVLTAGEKTAHRRSRAAPQLKCTAGPCERAPSRVVCQQIGWDGRLCFGLLCGYRLTFPIQTANPNWDCTATMTGARFRKLDVVCEGYDSPDDPYVLAGSCGLEYTLEATGHQTASRHLTSESSSYDSTGDFMTSACVVTLITLIYCCYSGVSGRSGSAGNVNPAENRHFPLGQGPNALLRAGFGGPGRAAPVDLGQPPEYHGPGVQGGDKSNAGGGGGMGFLQGLAGGSALGYLASRWQRHAAEQEAPPAAAYVRPAHSSGHAAVSGSDVQTGYATTKRRGEDSWLGGLVGSSSSSRVAAPSAPSQSAARPAAAPEPAGSDVQTGYATTKRRGDDSLWSRLTGSGSAATVVSEPPVSSATSQPAPVSAAAPEQPDVQTGFAGTKRRGDDSIISRFIGTTPTPATIVTPPVGSATSQQATATRFAPSSTDVDPNVQTGYATTKRRGDKSDTDSSLAAASQMRSERLAAQMGTFNEDTTATQSGYATTKRR